MELTKDKFVKFLNSYWQDNDPERAMLLWKHQLNTNAQTAAVYLDCLNQVIVKPPENLPQIMQQEGWIGLFDEDTDEVLPYEEHLQWLKKMKTDFQKAFDDFTTNPEFQLRELMQYFLLAKTQSQTLVLWKEFQATNGNKAKAYIGALDHLIKEPGPNLINIIQTFGRIYLMNSDGSSYTKKEQITWLKELKDKLESV